jgi:hypothetical protein
MRLIKVLCPLIIRLLFNSAQRVWLFVGRILYFENSPNLYWSWKISIFWWKLVHECLYSGNNLQNCVTEVTCISIHVLWKPKYKRNTANNMPYDTYFSHILTGARQRFPVQDTHARFFFLTFSPVWDKLCPCETAMWDFSFSHTYLCKIGKSLSYMSRDAFLHMYYFTIKSILQFVYKTTVMLNIRKILLFNGRRILWEKNDQT